MLQTTNPFQHWRRITTDRKVEQTEPVRYPSKENTLKVFVLNMRGQPLMPCSPPKARKLLRAGKAVPVRRTPFVIQLTVPTGETKQPITLGVDAGYKHVGLSATTAKEELLASEVELWQDVTGLLSDRLALRRARRNRKTRYRAPRFDNRVRSKHKGWLAPSVENRIQAHISRIVEGLPKTHCADAFCIAGVLDAKRRGEYLFQKQTRRHNRQIHKLTILKGGVRKRHQAPYLVHGFRLFDKVLCKGEVGFIFGRRSSGAFDVRRLNGTKISAGISYKKLSLLEKRKMFLTELRKEGRDSSRV